VNFVGFKGGDINHRGRILYLCRPTAMGGPGFRGMNLVLVGEGRREEPGVVREGGGSGRQGIRAKKNPNGGVDPAIRGQS